MEEAKKAEKTEIRRRSKGRRKGGGRSTKLKMCAADGNYISCVLNSPLPLETGRLGVV